MVTTMSFIKKIKRGGSTYLAEVRNIRVKGKVVHQNFKRSYKFKSCTTLALQQSSGSFFYLLFILSSAFRIKVTSLQFGFGYFAHSSIKRARKPVQSLFF